MNTMMGRPEFRREFHGAQRLAVALRLGLAEIAGHALLGIAPFLAAHHHHRLAMKPSHAGDQRGIVREIAVAMNFAEIFEEQPDVILGVGPLRMARQQQALPGNEIRVEVALELLDFALQAVDVRAGRVGWAGQTPQVGHVAFERLNFAVFFSFELLDSIRRSRLRTGLRR